MTMTPVAIVLGTLGVVSLLLALARQVLPADPDRHESAAGAIFSMVGVLYAVILAFVVIVVWENDGKARDDSQVEANAASRIYFTARSLPEPQRTELMGLAHDYVATVAGPEWSQMAHGQTSPQARQHVAAMRLTAHELRPATADQEILMSGTLAAVDALVDARRERTSALTAPLTPLMWSGLIVSSVLTVGFMFLFNRPSFAVHLLMVGSVAALIAFILWLVYDLSLPFTGLSAVGPEAFEQILQRFQEFPPDSPS